MDLVKPPKTVVLKRGARLPNMEGVINQCNKKNICFYNLKLREAFNKGQLLKGGVVEKRLRAIALKIVWRYV